MKKIVIIALGLLTTLPASAIVHRDGGGLSTTDPEQMFLRVKNSESSTALAFGDVVCADLSADDGVSVKLCTSSGIHAQCVAVQAIAAGKFGRCQVYGYINGLKVSAGTNNISAGGRLVINSESAAGKADGKSTGESMGFALDAASSSTTIEAFLLML